MADDTAVPFWWILLFVLLALGAGAGAVLFVGGQVLSVGIGGYVGAGNVEIGEVVGAGVVETGVVGTVVARAA